MDIPSHKKLHDISSDLIAGKIGIIPTDTTYGVVACAANEAAVARLYALKGRSDKPGTLIAANIDQLVKLGVKKRYLTVVEQYWPGPVSIIIPLGFSLPYLHLGKQSLAMRLPDNDELVALLKKTGPLLTSSANHPGNAPASTIGQAERYFGDKVDFYVDGGDKSGAEASTIIRVVDDAVEVIRYGAVAIDEGTGRVLE